MNQPIPDAEPRVLGQLLTAHSALSVFSDNRRMAEFIQRTVESVPGVSSCVVCLRGGERPRMGAAGIHECDACAIYRAEIGQGAAGQCPLSNRPDFRVFPLDTQEAHYGFLLLKLANDKRFVPYEPFVNNLANSLALNAERRRQKQQLEAANDELLKLRDHLQDLVEKRTAALETANDRLQHLNVVLRSIRGVNQIIVREDKLERLVQAVCECLIETRCYANAWIALAGPSGELMPRGVAGTDELYVGAVQHLGPANGLHCIASALEHPGVIAVEDPHATCSGCSLLHKDPGLSAMAIRLEHGERRFGVLVVSADRKSANDEEEHALLVEVAEDIGLALHSIEQESTRKRAEEALRDSEERYRTLFHDATDGIALADAATGAIIDSNEALCRMVERDRSELIGQPQSILHGSRHLIDNQPPTFRQHQTGDPGAVLEDRLLARSGKIIDVEIRAARIRMADHDYLLGIFRDVTERKKLEAQVLQSQKMESVGQLAGGVAHDFNNLLTAILGYTAMTKSQLPADSPLLHNLDQVSEAGERAANLTRQLLLFGRREAMERRPIALNRTVEGLLKMLKRLIGEDIRVTTDLAASPWTVRADEGKLEQVIMNLAVNARDAMPGGGALTISTCNVTLDQAAAATRLQARPGDFVRLQVSDTGCGIAAEALPHIFEPFFSTKPMGKGTGLGLSVVYGIVQQHEGWVEVQSPPGSGTVFSVWLPAVQVAAPLPQTAPTSKDLRGRGEHVLVVEDDDTIRELAATILRDNGYVVVGAAASVSEATHLVTAEAARLQLVISDVVLPDGTGLSVVDHVERTLPGVAVLLATGYTDEKSQWSVVQKRGIPFVRKPYDIATLLKAARQALASHAERRAKAGGG